MLVGLIADVHANLEALHACLAHARRAGAERYAVLGDLVGYGADPQAVVDTVRAELSSGSLAVRGNHDTAVSADAGYMNDSARRSMAWTRNTLDSAAKSFLAGLPLTARLGGAFLVHASARLPERFDYVDSAAEAQRSAAAANATWTFCGHVHDQMLYFATARGRMTAFRPAPGTAVPIRAPRRWLAIAGSVGQPHDGDPSAAYALWDAAGPSITFHRVAYEWHAAAAKVRRAGLPEAIAVRVERGI